MAYERTWQFLPVQGPRVTTSAQDANAWWLWNIKAFLTGQIGGATQGLWTVAGSSDGTTFGMDGVDRWTASYNSSLIPFGVGVGVRGWCVLTRSVGGQQLWLTLANGSNAASGTCYWVSLSGAVPAGGTTTVSPQSTIVLGGQSYGQLSILTYSADVTNTRRIAGGLTTTGDFWMVGTILGEVTDGVLFQKPFGTKVNDQWPFYLHAVPYYAGNSSYPFAGTCLWSTNPGVGSSGATRYYNSSTGAVNALAQPPAYVLLDASDISLFDWPLWVYTGNSATPSAIHARGRLSDFGAASGATAGVPSAIRPVNVGSPIRDVGGNVVYITLNQLIVPYNSLIS